MSDTLGNPPQQIAQVGQMPEAAPRPPDWRGPLRVVGVLAALAVIVAAALFIRDRLNPPPANDPVRGQQILTKAEAANLQDTTFTIAGTVGASFGGAGISTPLDGNGELTRNPQRLHLTLSAQIVTSLNVEIVEDGTTYYVKSAQLNSSSDKPWTKTDSANGLDGIAFTQFLDYRYIQHPVYIGDESISGHDTYHIRADLTSQIAGTVATATPAGTSANVTEDLWFIKSNYLPIKITLHAGGDTGSSTTAISAKVDETFTFTKWNTGLTIAVPPPDQVQ
jgi:hypothetical protein